MAEYNPSKIIKDGNTYNFRDTTKIPLAGSNQISGSLIPATDNAYDLGDSTHGFKNVYAYKLMLKNSYIVRTENNDYLGLCGGTDYSSGAYFTLYGKDSTINAGAFRLRANDGTNSKDLIGTPSGTLSWAGTSIVPSNNNTCDLGSSTNKWKSLNGIAPDELGLPTSTYTDVSSYITNFNSTPNDFTAPVSGLLFIEGTNSTPTECAINNNTKQYRMIVPYAFYNIRGLFPVEKGDNISVYIYKLSNLTQAKIFHLKGKV